MNITKRMNYIGYSKLDVKISDDLVDWISKDILEKKKKEISFFGEDVCNQKAYFDIVKCLYDGESEYNEILCSDWLNNSVNELIGNNAIIYDVFGLINIDQKNNSHKRNEWHRDQMYLGGIRSSILYFIPLVDFSEDIGPTEVVPGSHLWSEIPKDNFCDNYYEKIIVKKGEVFVVDAALIHRAGLNILNKERPTLLIRYQLPFLIRQINLARYYEKIKDSIPQVLMKRFGFGLEFDNVIESITKKRPFENIYEVKKYNA